jgi:spermidine synthase
MIKALKHLAGKSAKPELVDCVRDEFGLMQVVDTATTRSLYFNTLVEQSRQYLHAPMTLGFEYQQCLFDRILAFAQDHSASNAPSICMLGVGGGTLATHCHYALPAAAQTLVDIRESVFDLAHDYFGLPHTPLIQTICQDAEAFVYEAAQNPEQACDTDFDIWVVDLYDQHTMPDAFSEPGFLHQLAACVKPPGLVLFNLWCGNAKATAQVIEFWEQQGDFSVTSYPTVNTGNIVLAVQART